MSTQSQESINALQKQVNNYIKNWSNRFKPETSTKLFVEKLSSCQDLHKCKFRSVYWRYYLQCFSNQRNKWINDINIFRQIYVDLKTKYLPINDDQLLTNVKQDVHRTMPEKKIFRNQNVQNIMVNVLVLWSIASPCGKRLSYRQGVHELLAPMIFVLKSDHENFKSIQESIKTLNTVNNTDIKIPEDAQIILNPEHLEADCFLMLCRLMFHVEPWYGTNRLFKNIKSQEGDHDYNQSSDKVPDSTASLLDGQMSRIEEDNENEHIDLKLERIHSQILRVIDYDLYHHLKTHDIIPQVYGIRWLRLLFGREFNHIDALTIWDYILLNLLKFDNLSKVTDFLFVAILVHIREKLLNGGEQECVTVLMKYPQINDATGILEHTRYYLENYSKLEKAFVISPKHHIKALQRNLFGNNGSKNPLNIKNRTNSNVDLKSNVKSAFDVFGKDVSNSFSDLKKTFNKWTENEFEGKINGDNITNTTPKIKMDSCAYQLQKSIDKLQEIIYNQTEKNSEGNLENSNGNDGKADNDNLGNMCLILANLKLTRDVLRDVLPLNSFDQFNNDSTNKKS